MKTTGKLWMAYLASWPEGQYMDETHIRINGKPEEDCGTILDDAVVEVTAGVILQELLSRDPQGLVRGLTTWLKAQSEVTFIVTVEASKAEAVRTAITAAGGSLQD